MSDDGRWSNAERLAVVVSLIAVALAVTVGVATFASPHRAASGHDRELEGYSFVYHPDSRVTVVKQSFTDNMSQLTLVGPKGSVAWTNASGGASKMSALFSERRLGARPGDNLTVTKRIGPNTTVPVETSQVPQKVSAGPFVLLYHQKPAVTVVNVDAAHTGTANLELVGPHGAVAWSNASLGSKPTAATFAYNRHAIGATPGDTLKLVRVDPQTGNRTTVTTSKIS
ncbi:MAG: hypothetical protein ABEJ28_02310 [Salinigranum sp.]